MKILIVSFYYSPELGAAPSRITNMAQGLLDDGHEIDVLTCLPNYPQGRILEGYRGKLSCKENMGGVTVFRYWTYATVSKNPLRRIVSMFSYSLMLWGFAKHIRRIRRYDRVIIQTPPIMVACSAMTLFRKVYRRKVVLNVSDLWPLSAIELGAVREGSAYHKILLRMERFLYNNAVAVQGQSGEILKHVSGCIGEKPLFLYRNLQHSVTILSFKNKPKKPFRIVYAGLLGVAQDILSIVRHIDFKQMGAELHLFGGGNQATEIECFIASHDTGVSYHGYLEKEKMVEELAHYNASIVPLARQIYGAVPSKIFDLLPVGVPILLCGSGEAAQIVTQYGLGFVSAPGDYESLKENIAKMTELTDIQYEQIVQKCITASQSDFSFVEQMKKYETFLRSL